MDSREFRLKTEEEDLVSRITWEHQKNAKAWRMWNMGIENSIDHEKCVLCQFKIQEYVTGFRVIRVRVFSLCAFILF